MNRGGQISAGRKSHRAAAGRVGGDDGLVDRISVERLPSPVAPKSLTLKTPSLFAEAIGFGASRLTSSIPVPLVLRLRLYCLLLALFQCS